MRLEYEPSWVRDEGRGLQGSDLRKNRKSRQGGSVESSGCSGVQAQFQDVGFKTGGSG